MGLDIFLYRISKTQGIEKGKKYTREEFYQNFPNSHLVSKKDANYNVKTIKKYGTPITLIELCYDVKLVAKAGGLDERKAQSLIVTGESCSKNQHLISFDVYDENSNLIGKVELTNQNEEQTLIEKEYEYLIFDATEIDYQRKGLNDFGWELLPNNCEYGDDKEKVKLMVKMGGLRKSFLENWINGETCILGWW